MLFYSDRFIDHITPSGHPESPERGEILRAAALRARNLGVTCREPRSATRDDLLRVHVAEYVDAIAATRGSAASLDPDTFTSPASYDVACLAAGAAIDAVDHAMVSGLPGCALVRPPGHHAERDRAMGFCLFGNVAVAAAHARANGAARVAIVDIDVHHGNGTQWMFYDDPTVLFVSTHQSPFYPGSGAAGEVGHADGVGYTLNIPLEAGATDADHALVWHTLIDPRLEAFVPDVILVSAGFDGHDADPLASQQMTTAGYAGWISALRRRAEQSCGGRLALVTEGGYDPEALRACLDATIDVLRAPAGTSAQWPQPDGDTHRGAAAVAAVRAALAL